MMADEYQQMYLEIDNITGNERAWVEPYLDEEWWQENNPEENRGFDLYLSKRTGNMIIESNEHVWIDNVSWFLRRFLADNRPGDEIIFEYCWHGNGENCGATVLVTAKSEVHFNPRGMAESWKKTGSCKPHVEEYKNAVDRLEDAINDKGLQEGGGECGGPAQAAGGAGEDHAPAAPGPVAGGGG
jgi:hypothetical protein